jgi:hypothetical protein
MSIRRFALVLAAALGAPAAATAGPIEFNYTTSANTFLNPSRHWGSSLTLELTPSGDVSLPASGGSVELGTIRLAPSSTPPLIFMPGPFTPEWPTGPTSESTAFAVFVTVTDAQGRSTELPIYSYTDERWVPGPGEGEWTPVYNKLAFGISRFGDNTDSWTTVLGTTEYTLAVRAEENDLVGVYTLSAAPSPTAATPEPATLALAAFGLVSLGARLVRRRVKIVGAARTPA